MRHHLQGGHADAAVESGRSERQPGAHVMLTQVAETVGSEKHTEQEDRSGRALLLSKINRYRGQLSTTGVQVELYAQ